LAKRFGGIFSGFGLTDFLGYGQCRTGCRLRCRARRAPFTLILANVNRNVIDKILPTIHTHAPNASVLLSGILKYDSAWLHHLMSNLTYRIESLTAENEWLCAFIKKPND
jgi:ribosomal protein L11 methyltransferase